MKVLAFFPVGQRLEKPLELGTRRFVIAAFGWLALQTVYFLPAGPGADLRQNLCVGVAFRVGLLVLVVGYLGDVWKYFKGRMRLLQVAF